MLDQGNRTFIGSVVFADIVGYSKKSVSEQIALKDRFTSLLAESLKDIALEQRIILDTGDGAAMSFLGDPEDALFVTMHMRDFLQRAYASLSLPENSAQEDIDIGPRRALGAYRHQLGPGEVVTRHQRPPEYCRRRHQCRATHHDLCTPRANCRVAFIFRCRLGHLG